MVDTLLARRDAIGRAYLEAVTPLDDFEIVRGQLCMTDLGVRFGLATSGSVEQLQGSRVADTRWVSARGTVCLPLPKHDAYTIYRLRTRRGAQTRPPLEIHLKGGPRARILGVLRVTP